MLEWHDFVEQLLSEESSFDGISLSFDGTAHSVGVPPIIKASVLMLDKMITHQGKFNILVFPERIQSIFIFTLIKLLHNIAEGKIERAYDPEAFKPGEKLKLGNAVVEFVGIEDEKNERRMKIKVADLTISAPIEYFPLFQLTNTQRRLSPYEKYVVEKKKIEGLVSHLTADEKFLKMLADYRTHMDSSIVSMTSVINAKELLSTNGKLDYLDKAYRDANVALQVFTQRYDECGNEKLVISMDHIVYTQALILCHKCFINDYSDISANTFAIHTLHTALNSPYNTYSFAKTDSFNYQSVVEKIVYATIANKGLVHPEAYGWLQDLFRLISETE